MDLVSAERTVRVDTATGPVTAPMGTLALTRPEVEGRTGVASDGAIPLNFGVCSVYLAGAGQAFTSLRRWIFGASGAILGA